MGALGLLAGTAFLLLASHALLKRLRTGSAPVDLLVFLLLFTALQSAMILLALLTGLLSFWPLTLASAAGLAALLAAGERPPPLRSLVPKRPDSAWDRALFWGVAIAFLSFFAKLAWFSPYWGDAIMYHLPSVAEWVRAGCLVSGFFHDVRVWLPAGFQLIETWWVVFLHHDALIELGGIQMLAIALAAVNVLARALGLHAGFAVFTAAYIPVVSLNVTTCSNDLAVGAMVLSAFALVAARAPHAFEAFPILLGVGIKPTAGMAAGGVILYAVLTGRSRPRPRVALLLPLLAGATLVSGFWYARNQHLTGTPFGPVFGGPGTMGHVANPNIGLENLWDTLAKFPDWARDRGIFEALAPDKTAWGWFVLGIGFPVTILSLRASPELRRLALVFFTSWLMVLVCVEDSGQQLRYALWFPVLFALAAARAPGRLLVTATLLAGALNLVATVIPRETTYVQGREDFPRDLPRDADLAVVFEECGYCYPLYNHDYSRRLHYPRSMEQLRASGARYVYVADPVPWVMPYRKWRKLGGRVYEVPRP